VCTELWTEFFIFRSRVSYIRLTVSGLSRVCCIQKLCIKLIIMTIYALHLCTPFFLLMARMWNMTIRLLAVLLDLAPGLRLRRGKSGSSGDSGCRWLRQNWVKREGNAREVVCALC
jgi:hypothetical protein